MVHRGSRKRSAAERSSAGARGVLRPPTAKRRMLVASSAHTPASLRQEPAGVAITVARLRVEAAQLAAAMESRAGRSLREQQQSHCARLLASQVCAAIPDRSEEYKARARVELVGFRRNKQSVPRTLIRYLYTPYACSDRDLSATVTTDHWTLDHLTVFFQRLQEDGYSVPERELLAAAIPIDHIKQVIEWLFSGSVEVKPSTIRRSCRRCRQPVCRCPVGKPVRQRRSRTAPALDSAQPSACPVSEAAAAAQLLALAPVCELK